MNGSSGKAECTIDDGREAQTDMNKTARLFFAGLTALAVASAQAPETKHTVTKHPIGKMGEAQKIALAESAGPADISKKAAIMDMTDMSAPKQIRTGTNGWICYAMEQQPMCLDKQWQNWATAWMGKTQPNIEATGIAYMLRGDHGASNTDPYAMAPTADNQWVVTPAHIMVIYPDPKMLDAFPTDPKSGGPFVMWKGTPYAHVMVPVSPTKSATMPSK